MAPIPRTRTRAAAPVPPEAAPLSAQPAPSRVVRHAAPAAPPAARTRTRSTPAPMAPATGLVTGLVELEHRVSGEVRHATSEIIHVSRRLPDGTFEPAMVRVGGGATLQPRQYESIRVDVSLTLPCFPDVAGYEGAYAEASTWVEAKIREQIDIAMN